MKKAQFVEANQIGFEELTENLVVLNLNGEKFVMDTDTMIDLTFRCAAFLTYLEGKEKREVSEHCFH
ncbi:hypothetical protein [Bdellovibrio sp.]|uniref:hypothetical protein n=1 Tax=Bdellovibrio sp. TaxID=28201 RepID=UPI0039E5BE3F